MELRIRRENWKPDPSSKALAAMATVHLRLGAVNELKAALLAFAWFLVASPIQSLLCRSCPTNVTRLIASVVIDPVDRVKRTGLDTHIGQEAPEVKPSLADSNPATAVVLVGRTCFIQTSGFHSRPRVIFRRIDESVLQRLIDTATTAGVPAFQFVAFGNKLDATATSAQVEVHRPCVFMAYAEKSDSVENRAGKVDV